MMLCLLSFSPCPVLPSLWCPVLAPGGFLYGLLAKHGKHPQRSSVPNAFHHFSGANPAAARCVGSAEAIVASAARIHPGETRARQQREEARRSSAVAYSHSQWRTATRSFRLGVSWGMEHGNATTATRQASRRGSSKHHTSATREPHHNAHAVPYCVALSLGARAGARSPPARARSRPAPATPHMEQL